MAKIIEAKAVIKGEDQISAVVDKIGKKLGQLAQGAKSSEAVDKMATALGKVKSQIAAIEKFNAAKIDFAKARQNFSAARSEVEKVARAMALADGPTGKMAASLARARANASAASRAFEAQASATIAAKRNLEALGLSAGNTASQQQRLASSIDRANRQLERQHKWRARIAGIPAIAGGIAAAVTTGRAAHFAGKAVVSAAEFDIGTRTQRVVSDVSERDQADILTPQAKKIGQDTQFTNLDVVKAQTTAMAGLPANITGRIKAEVAAGILDNVKNYALVMQADLATSAEAIRSYLQATGKDISTKEKALAEANKATNQLVRMAKLGSMSDEDVQHYLNFAMPSLTAAGVSPEAGMAIAALARRGGLRGDVAGVFMRTTASKLVAPTKKGITALNAAGIDYNKFVRMPDSLSVDKLESHFGNEMGTAFTPEVRARLAAALADKATVGNRSTFTEAVTSIVAEQFPKTKKGEISAADRQKIAKAAGGFHKVSAASVDAEGLLDKVMASDMTLAQLNAFLTDKHGGKGAITQRQREEYVSARRSLQGVGDDPDFAKKKADEIMGGLGGSFERLKGSVENLVLSVGQAAESVFKLPALFEGLGNALDWVSNLPKPVVAGGAVAAGVGAVGGAAWLVSGLANGFGLSTSAVALDGSAAALTRAAIALGAGKAADLPVTGADKTGWLKSTWDKAWPAVTAAGAYAPHAAVAAGAAYGLYGLYEQSAPYAGMTMGERARARRGGGTVTDARRQQFNEDRARQGLPPLGEGASPISLAGIRSTLGLDGVKAELHGSAEVKGEAKITIEIPGVTTRTVGVPLSGRLDNGAGSLGVSSPDAQPWRGGIGAR